MTKSGKRNKTKAKKKSPKKRLLRRRVVTLRALKAKASRASKKIATKTIKKRQEVRYILNSDFEFFYELRDLILKSSPAEKDKMIARINNLGRVRLAVVSGIFVNRENTDPTVADLLIVGDDIDRSRLSNFLKSLEAEVGKEIKFAVMEKEEFQYRLAMFDRFVRVILEAPHEKIINRLGI